MDIDIYAWSTFVPEETGNASGERNTRYCEKNHDAAYKVNVEGTKNIVAARKTINAKRAFISSDLVFDGTKGKYSEEDVVNPLSIYGKQKVMAEKVIKANLDNWLIARASSIYGWDPGRDNFIFSGYSIIKGLQAMKKDALNSTKGGLLW